MSGKGVRFIRKGCDVRERLGCQGEDGPVYVWGGCLLKREIRTIKEQCYCKSGSVLPPDTIVHLEW